MSIYIDYLQIKVNYLYFEECFGIIIIEVRNDFKQIKRRWVYVVDDYYQNIRNNNRYFNWNSAYYNRGTAKQIQVIKRLYVKAPDNELPQIVRTAQKAPMAY